MGVEPDIGELIWRGGTAWAVVRGRHCHLGQVSSEARAIELADELCLRYEPGSEGMDALRPQDWRSSQRERIA